MEHFAQPINFIRLVRIWFDYRKSIAIIRKFRSRPLQFPFDCKSYERIETRSNSKLAKFTCGEQQAIDFVSIKSDVRISWMEKGGYVEQSDWNAENKGE